MEIWAKVYAVAEDENLLKQVHQALKAKTFQDYFFSEMLEPCTVLPLARTWYTFTQRAEPSGGPEEWLGCLRECAGILRKNGAVVVQFTSPDHPDYYMGYAYTTSAGSAGKSSKPATFAYDRARGDREISMAIDELLSERTAQERIRASRRIEKKEAARREKGDFEITPDGVLKKYRGTDEDVVIPDGVKVIGESAFVDMKGVERMIMECEQYDAPAMTTLTIPDSVTEIRDYAFAYCANLKAVDISDSVRKIGDRAFEGCESLSRIRLSASLTEIDENTFFLCWNLKTIDIPEGVSHIREGAFMDCGLTKVNLPKSLVSIGKDAFRSCSHLKKVTIPANVTDIAPNAFPAGTQLIRTPEK